MNSACEFISDKKTFDGLTSEIYTIIEKDVGLPAMLFKDEIGDYLAFEFEQIFGKCFFSGIVNYSIKTNNHSIVFYILEPSPNDYFFKHFAKYSVFKIDNSTSYEEFEDILSNDPGESKADAIVYNSDVILVMPESRDWIVYGSRNWEIAIIGFRNSKTKNAFSDCFNVCDILESVEARVNTIKEQIDQNQEVADFFESLLNTYS